MSAPVDAPTTLEPSGSEPPARLSPELVAALAAAQGEFAHIAKGKTATVQGKTKDGRPYNYEYRFSDLADVLEAVRPALSKHGLAVIQRPTVAAGEGGKPTLAVETILAHTSGGWIASTLALPVASLEIQAVGSALTYLRRYSLLALLGISPAGEDDDGNGAPGQPRGAAGASSSRGRSAPAPAEASKEKPAKGRQEREAATASQLKLVWAKARERAREFVEEGDGEAEKQLAEEIVRAAIAPLESTRELARGQVDGALERIAAFEPPEQAAP